MGKHLPRLYANTHSLRVDEETGEVGGGGWGGGWRVE